MSVTKDGITAKYNGTIDALTGKEAIVKIDGRQPAKCTAKFLDETGLPICYQGYNPYPTNHFNIRPSQQVEYWEIQGRNE